MIFSFKLQDDFKNKQQMSAQLGQPMLELVKYLRKITTVNFQ